MPTSSLFPQPSPGGASSAALGAAAANGVAAAAANGAVVGSSLSLNSLEMELSGLANGHHQNGGHHNLLDDLQQNGRHQQQQQQQQPRSVTQLAMELAMLQQGSSLDHHQHPHHHHHAGLTSTSSLGPGGLHLNPDNPLLHPYGVAAHHHSSSSSSSAAAMGGVGGSLEDLKTQRRSQNMTECVPVPTSEHVAEIVGRQGCKIKALRAKTNTYIKTPVRGEEPVFVVTGRKEDVALAKREILSAAEHFSQIRASRSKHSLVGGGLSSAVGGVGGVNSTLAFGQMVANQPGQTTAQVRVPYRVVGLVVGPKGATIKRIQQTTHTYIVTPSRDKEPVFEVTGLPENVEAARKEIEAHIALRTGADSLGNSSNSSGSSGIGNIYGIGEHPLNHGNHGHVSDSGFGSFNSGSMDGHLNNGHLANGSSSNKFNSILNGDFKSSGLTLNNILADANGTSHWGNPSGGGNSHNPLTGTRSGDAGLTAWSSNGGTEDYLRQQQMKSSSQHRQSSPSFESNGHHSSDLASSGGAASSGIWGEVNLNKLLGGLDLNGDGGEGGGTKGAAAEGSNPLMMGLMHATESLTQLEVGKSSSSAFLNVGSRSSLDLGTLGRPTQPSNNNPNSLDLGSNSSSSSSHHTATPPSQGADASPPSSLPFAAGLHRASVSSEPLGGGGGGGVRTIFDEVDLASLAAEMKPVGEFVKLEMEDIDGGNNKSVSSNTREGINGHQVLSFDK